jgi:glycosyltransferase involved in cell wall biosynthesis
MISVVVPAFNEESAIRLLHERLTAAAETWGENYEIILVDDGSRDRTLEICRQIAEEDPHLRVLSFSRNFGHQAAVTAGLQHCSGDVAAVIDADLQDPPEVIGRFIEKCREGFDVVYAIRTKRKENLAKRAGYFLYYRLLKRLSALDIPLDAGDFCVISRTALDAINSLPERNRFVRGLRTWVGYRQTGLAYERDSRQAGEPKYTFSNLVRLAMDGIINFSYKPLQLVTFSGLLLGLFTILAGIGVTFLFITDTTVLGYNPRQVRGWTSLALALSLLSGVQLISLGILGEYLGRVFEEVKSRPTFIIRTKVNFERDTQHLRFVPDEHQSVVNLALQTGVSSSPGQPEVYSGSTRRTL